MILDYIYRLCSHVNNSSVLDCTNLCSCTGRPSFICNSNILYVIFIVNVCIYSKRFQNEIKIMKYLNIPDSLYFVVVMCCFGLVSGAGRNKKVDIYATLNAYQSRTVDTSARITIVHTTNQNRDKSALYRCSVRTCRLPD